MKFEIRKLRFVFAGAAVLLLAGCGRPADPLAPDSFTAHAVLSTNRITVGGPAVLTMTARHPEGSAVRFPAPANDGDTIILDRTSVQRKQGRGLLETQETIRLTSFRTGERRLAGDTAVCRFADGTEAAQPLPELMLQVQSVLNETNAAALSDIKDIVRPPFRPAPLVWVLLAVALLAVVAGAAALLLRRKPRAVPAPPPLPPDVIARRALDELRAGPWIPEPFFTRLSLILRTYLEGRFRIQAPESTTEELTRAMMTDRRLNTREQQSLLDFLTQADLVKFARAGAEQDVMQCALDIVARFIDETPPPASAETPPDGGTGTP